MSKKKYVNLLQYHEPLMDAGDYEITVQQTLHIRSKNLTDTFPATVRRFSVFGDRFELAPDAIFAKYPPPGSQGEHSATLPHLVLNRSTLPWERSVDGGRDGIWLALLLFDEAETPARQSLSLGDYKKLLGFKLSSTATGPTDNGPFHEQADGPDEQPVTVIKVRRRVLEKTMPRRADLDYTAHSRRQSEKDNPADLGETGPERAVILGTRLPRAGELSTVHLVSLENRFADGGEFNYGSAGPDDEVTLLSLHSWSFRSELPKFNFFGLLEHLNRVPAQLSVPFLNDQTLDLAGGTDRSRYGFRVLPNRESVTTTDNGELIFDGQQFLQIEIPDTAIDADEAPQLDPFPAPEAFTVALTVRLEADNGPALQPLFGATVEGRHKPSLWYRHRTDEAPAALRYQLSSEDGQLFSGEVLAYPTAGQSTDLAWVKRGSELIFYQNGHQLATRPGQARMFTHDSPLFVGTTDPDDPGRLRGQLHQLHIFRRALPANELHTLFSPHRGTRSALAGRYLAQGAVALPHQLRRGDRAVSWYRGPLSLPAADPGFSMPAVAADQLLVFDQTSGMFDTSYAAAWQLGRLLALEDPQFSQDLYQWKRHQARHQKQQTAKTHLPLRAVQRPVVARVTLFRQQGFQGEALRLTDHGAGQSLRRLDGLNDRINSLRADLPPGWELELFEHVDFQGEKLTVTADWDAADLPRWRNRLSSLRLVSPTEKKLRAWLRRCHRLEGVPFSYLVPHPDMLPTEGIRFFQLDPRWVRCLKDGAASLGRSSTADFLLDQQTDLAAEAVPAASGFLLRSSLVRDYPGLQVLAFAKQPPNTAPPDESEALPLLRREKLSDDLLLCLFAGEVGSVELFQKPESLHYGLNTDGERFSKQLRYANGASFPEALPDFALKPSHWHDRSARLLNFAKMARGTTYSLRGRLKAALSEEEFGPFQQFTSADFALQMLEGVEKVRFTV